jgi:DNA polymerase-3 subunit gamma/tau
MADSKVNSSPEPYRVLARKYRPQNFDELIGQEALVRTLKNAIESGRIAHAYMLTGVRGVGKTTTARIIAKALNYKGADGKAGPTTGPTDDCSLCRAISEDRHPDVIEMDAASRTGVDDIREILDGVRYAPTEARYKIYIIDEVHMLSKNAFNALLKTLEEPPPHVKFIFATTEIRKVPITVLSRCQRFDLRRVDVETLSVHFKNICKAEKVTVEDEAIALISDGADGSVRDGLSLLDRAIALGGDKVAATQVRDMLGLADRARSLDLLEKSLTGAMAEALSIMDALYKDGADSVALIQDLLDYTHMLTRLRAVPDAKAMKQMLSAEEAERLAKLSKELSMATLGKTWQILLKGLNEVQQAPDAQAAAEMVLIRLAYAADLPDPAELIRKLKDQPVSSSAQNSSPASSPSRETVRASAPPASSGGGRTQAALRPQEAPQEFTERALHSLSDIVSVLEASGELVLAGEVYQCVHLVKLEQGRIEIRPSELAAPRLAQDLGQQLSRITGARWIVSVSSSPGQMTLAQQAGAAKAEEFAKVMKNPEVANIFSIFPDARLTDIIEDKKKDAL